MTARAEQHRALQEGEGHQLLHQQVEYERAEDSALRRPVLQLAEAGLVALELDSGTAVLEVVTEPASSLPRTPFLASAVRMAWGLASSNAYSRSRKTASVGRWLA